MTVGLLRRAIAIYVAIAWEGKPAPAAELPGNDEDPLEPALATLVAEGRVTDETLRAGEVASRISTLRLGNPRYPFMKLVLQEHLVEGLFFFSVDTHDQMFTGDDGPEQAELQELKCFNLDLKDRIEHAWDEAASRPPRTSRAWSRPGLRGGSRPTAGASSSWTTTGTSPPRWRSCWRRVATR